MLGKIEICEILFNPLLFAYPLLIRIRNAQVDYTWIIHNTFYVFIPIQLQEH